MELGRFKYPPHPIFFLKTRVRLWHRKSSVMFIFLIPSGIVFYPFQRLGPLCHQTHYYKCSFLKVFFSFFFVSPICHSKATNVFLSSCIFFLFSAGKDDGQLYWPYRHFFPCPATNFSWPCRNFFPVFQNFAGFRQFAGCFHP